MEALVTAESLSETTPEFDEKTKPRPLLTGAAPLSGWNPPRPAGGIPSQQLDE